jgi:hypothetical protein
MNISTLLARLAAMTLATATALPLLAADAMAAKEKFERTKPHVNVGTIGHVDNPNPAELTAPAGETTPTSNNSGASDCKPNPSKAEDQPTC